MSPIIGVDIGGSHITSAAVDLKTAQLRSDTVARSVVRRKGTADEILSSWASAINQSLAPLAGVPGERLVGVSVPGAFDYARGIAYYEGNDKYEALYGLDIGAALGERLDGDVQLRFINDAAGCGVGISIEHGHTEKNALVLTIGTGIGAVFLKNGVPIFGGETVPEAGSIWHLAFRDGIADDYLSTRWIVGQAGKLNIEVEGAKPLAEMATLRADVADIFERLGAMIAEVAAPWLSKFEAEELILGGSISESAHLFQPSLEKTLEKAGLRLDVSVCTQTEHAAVLGGAMLFDERFWAEIKDTLPQK